MARILVIEDSTTVFTRIKHLLDARGHDVHRLTCFIELPSVLRQSPPDLIILDLQIPVMPGTAFARYVRNYEPRRIPIIIHSSCDEAVIRQAVLETGAVGSVPKDASEQSFVRAVSNAIEGRTT